MMKLRRKSRAGLVTNEKTYKQYYPELSKQYSYEQFIGEVVVEDNTHCIGSQKLRNEDGLVRDIYLGVDEELTKYMYRGTTVFVERESGKLFMCDPIPISDVLYVSCYFGAIKVAKLPPMQLDQSTINTISFPLKNIPTAKLKDEFLEAIKEKSDDVTVVQIIKRQLREVFESGLF